MKIYGKNEQIRSDILGINYGGKIELNNYNSNVIDIGYYKPEVTRAYIKYENETNITFELEQDKNIIVVGITTINNKSTSFNDILVFNNLYDFSDVGRDLQQTRTNIDNVGLSRNPKLLAYHYKSNINQQENALVYPHTMATNNKSLSDTFQMLYLKNNHNGAILIANNLQFFFFFFFFFYFSFHVILNQ